MSKEKKQRLKEYQRDYREANKGKKSDFCQSNISIVLLIVILMTKIWSYTIKFHMIKKHY